MLANNMFPPPQLIKLLNTEPASKKKTPGVTQASVGSVLLRFGRIK